MDKSKVVSTQYPRNKNGFRFRQRKEIQAWKRKKRFFFYKSRKRDVIIIKQKQKRDVIINGLVQGISWLWLLNQPMPNILQPSVTTIVGQQHPASCPR